MNLRVLRGRRRLEELLLLALLLLLAERRRVDEAAQRRREVFRVDVDVIPRSGLDEPHVFPRGCLLLLLLLSLRLWL